MPKMTLSSNRATSLALIVLLAFSGGLLLTTQSQAHAGTLCGNSGWCTQVRLSDTSDVSSRDWTIQLSYCSYPPNTWTGVLPSYSSNGVWTLTSSQQTSCENGGGTPEYGASIAWTDIAEASYVSSTASISSSIANLASTGVYWMCVSVPNSGYGSYSGALDIYDNGVLQWSQLVSGITEGNCVQLT